MRYFQTDSGRGLAALVCAYTLWALGVVLFKQFSGRIAAADVVAWRGVFSLLFLLGVVAYVGKSATPHPLAWCGHLIKQWSILKNARLTCGLGISAALVGVNWLVFVWSIETERVLQSSLGYYINPLVTVWLGVLILGESLRPAQTAAMALATASVCAMLLLLGILPWIPVALAVSFALYGLARKILGVDAIQGLFIETLFLLPIALAWLAWGDVGGLAVSEYGAVDWALLALCGPATAVPLLLFVYGVRRRSLTVTGFTQYINPTLQFLLAVVIYGEMFGRLHLLIFAGVWVALAVFLADLYRHEKRRADIPLEKP